MDEVLELFNEVETKSQIMQIQDPVQYEALVIHCNMWMIVYLPGSKQR